MIKHVNITVEQSTEREYYETRVKYYAKYFCNHHKHEMSGEYLFL